MSFKNKVFWQIIAMCSCAVYTLVSLNGCSADYDTFGKSDYCVLSEITFAEQESSPAVYSNNHRMVFDLVAPPESLETWNSVTIDAIDMSHFASLHLVKGKVEEFPTDSVALDSLAQKISVSDESIKMGEKIDIPSSHVLYVVVISESGKKAVWQLVFNIPEVKPKSSSSNSVKSSSSASSSSSVKSVASSSSSAKSASSSNSGKSSESSSSAKNESSSSAASVASSSSAAKSSQPPKILALSIAGLAAVVNEESKSIHVDDLDFRTDLTSLELSDLELSEGASANIKVGESYDFSTGVQVTVMNGNDESETYTVKAGYQLPGSNFNSWKGDDVTPDSIWGNANTILTTTKKITSGSLIGAQIQTSSVLGKVASGSLYTADFNPKGVGTLSMANASTWPDGNELLDFGKPFAARPEFMEVKFSYEGKGDSCDIYILLENRTGDRNINRKAGDVNKLVASAWFRSTKADNSGRENPDVVSVSEPDENGMRTLLLKLKYGEPLAGSPIENSSTFNTELESSNKSAVNNGLEQGSGEEPVTHIRVVFASSANGNHYEGIKGATLIIDEMRLIY
ncbi:PCMD domain-containing protein [Fibrobacter sp. UWB11]|uniref:PCMD domain-containing protein n=1 Tax=Fibrobacter sp. UWB11 TaxID=1896202 RepID=UPI00092627C5|nr:PCMD domain-containing protein [Fibrobacter sp. UWB11]SIO05857.1 Putative carbohydrate metabolism domain-containing protein [Fibrobacter sp. UWB11]